MLYGVEFFTFFACFSMRRMTKKKHNTGRCREVISIIYDYGITANDTNRKTQLSCFIHSIKIQQQQQKQKPFQRNDSEL